MSDNEQRLECIVQAVKTSNLETPKEEVVARAKAYYEFVQGASTRSDAQG